MSQTATYQVPGMSCEHCRMSVTEEVSEVAGVESVDVDLDRKLVTVTAPTLDDEAIRTAIHEAGYEVA